MGKHQRANRAEMERLRKRNRNIRIGIGVFTGALALGVAGLVLRDSDSSASSAGVPQAVTDGADSYIAKYGCYDEDEITITMTPIDERLTPDEITLGITDGDSISISDYITDPVELWSTSAHEMAHACTKELNLFPQPLEHPSFNTPVVGSYGFKLYYEDTAYSKEMEEAVVEWLSSGIDGYRPADAQSYIATSELMRQIATFRGLSREQVADLHQNSDLLGFIALVKSKPVTDVNASDLSDITMLFQDAFYDYELPTYEELDFFLNFQTTI